MSKRRVEISDAAAADLAAIFRYTREQWGETQAVAYIDALDAGFQRIAAKPSLGRTRFELLKGARSRLIGKHVVFYNLDESKVVILRIVHPAQDPVTLRGVGPDA